MTAIRSTFLRAVIGLDAAVCGALGAAFAAGGASAAQATGLSTAFTHPIALFLLGYAVLLAWMAARPASPRVVVWGLVAFNLLWAVESVLVIALGWITPNGIGEGLILVQAAGALGVAGLQALALRMGRAATA